jgi:hypothetical protein
MAIACLVLGSRQSRIHTQPSGVSDDSVEKLARRACRVPKGLYVLYLSHSTRIFSWRLGFIEPVNVRVFVNRNGSLLTLWMTRQPLRRKDWETRISLDQSNGNDPHRSAWLGPAMRLRTTSASCLANASTQYYAE